MSATQTPTRPVDAGDSPPEKENARPGEPGTGSSGERSANKHQLRRAQARPSLSGWLATHPCPDSGSGVHRWLLSVGLAALRRAVDADEAEAAIIAAMTRPPNSRTEVRDALHKAGAVAFHGPPIHRSRWPKPAVGTTAERYAALGRQRGVVELADVWERSPVRLHDDAPLTETIISRLFRPDELLCCARGVEHAETRRSREFAGRLHEFTHLVPSPMSAFTGLTQEGRKSCRCLANTGPRRFLVIEFDREASLHRQAQLHFGLATHAPLVLVVFSGKKSLHGWYFVEGWPDAEAHKLHRLAVACGADAATWTPCQLVRMPDAQRPDTGQRQGVYTWNPNHGEAAR